MDQSELREVTQEPEDEDEGEDGIMHYRIEPDGSIIREFVPHGSTSVQIWGTNRRYDNLGREEVILYQQDAGELVDNLFGSIKPYSYAPLDNAFKGHLSTRVVELHPGKDKDRLTCTIRNVDLKDAPVYEALSYTWKETSHERLVLPKWEKHTNDGARAFLDIRHPVYVDRCRLLVNTGLRDALLRLRSPSETKAFWIDQLSIDQNDTGERAFQVSLMHYIYNRAQRVVIWTGEEDEFTSPAFDLIEKLSPRCNVPERFLPTPLEITNLTDLGLPPFSSPEWQSLLKFYQRPVFRRAWVIQEIALGQKLIVRYGGREVEWYKIANVAELLCQGSWLTVPWRLEDRGQSRPDYVVHIKKYRKQFQESKEMTVQTLLSVTRSFQATDPRDKVYSILTLRSTKPETTASGRILADYTKPTADVFRDVTKIAILQERSIDLFSGIEDVALREIQGLPSWVPDYSVNPTSNVFGLPDIRNPYRAAGDSSASTIWPGDDDPNLVVVSAYKADTIRAVSDGEVKEGMGKALLAWSRLASTLGPTYLTGEDTVSAFWRTCMGNAALAWREYPAPTDYFHQFACFFLDNVGAYLGMDSDSNEGSPNPGWRTQICPIMIEMTNAWNPDIKGDGLGVMACLAAVVNRKLFVTEKGYMGLCPRSTRAGDMVYILSGGRTPFILRSMVSEHEGTLEGRGGREREFQMMGEAYVHGLMNGEALQGESFGWKGVHIR